MSRDLQESGSTSGEEEYSEEDASSGGEESASESDEESEEEPEEPVLKYKRFAKDVVFGISQGPGGQKNIICCIAVHPKFIALGTGDGTIKLLDHAGTTLMDRIYTLHSGQINQISVDDEGEFLASCSDDGKVSIVGLFTTKYNNSVTFDRMVKSVALHPHFSKSTNHMFVAGTDRLVMIEERRWPMGNKTMELHGGYGPIPTIKWKENLIAWANDKMVLVYDITLRERIASISFEEESPTYLPCSLYWQNCTTLLVGRGHFVKTVAVKEGEGYDPLESYSAEMDAPRRKRYMAIVSQNAFPEFLVCGVVPIFDDQKDWKLVVLCYDAKIDQNEAIHRNRVPPPHMLVVPPGRYLPNERIFEVPESTACDKLLPRGHMCYRSDEYHLECVLGEDRFYIVCPIDILLAEKRDANDHIDWLLRQGKFEEAMKFVENPQVAKVLHPGKLQLIGIKYVHHLIRTANFTEAAKKCHEIFGPEDKSRWEDVVISFMDKNQLPVLLPFIPMNEPKLSPAVYELVLNALLKTDCKLLYKVIETWPTSLYNPNTIILVVEDRLRFEPNNGDLLKVKALLHEDLQQFDKALKIYLQQGHVEVFDLIRKRELYAALVEHLTLLMQLGTEQTVKLLVDCRADIPPQRVVRKLEASGRQEYLHKYLDGLFERDPKAGGENHERQVELYAKYDAEKLLPFLRSCNDIPLQKALQVCEHYKRYEEMVYLLARMGNPKAALELIIKKLEDVDKAIEFAMEEGDEELWEVLISLSIHNPKFITGLLNNVGTHIDPTKLIQKIPERTEIPDLGASLVKLLQDFRVQVNLREGCKKILVKDSHSLMEKLHRLQKRALSMDDEAICRTCGAEVIGVDEDSRYVMFFCGHIYHYRCVSKKNEVQMCRLCYAGARSGTRSRPRSGPETKNMQFRDSSRL